MVVPVDIATFAVAIPKSADVAPCETVTFGGTVTALLALDSETSAPPLGAALDSATRPVDEAPPVTLCGFAATDASVATPPAEGRQPS